MKPAIKLTPEMKKFIKENVSADKIIFCKDNTIKLRRTFFYTHGQTVGTQQGKWVDAFYKLGFELFVYKEWDRTFEKYARWPHDSYWQVTLEIVADNRTTK